MKRKLTRSEVEIQLALAIRVFRDAPDQGINMINYVLKRFPDLADFVLKLIVEVARHEA